MPFLYVLFAAISNVQAWALQTVKKGHFERIGLGRRTGEADTFRAKDRVRVAFGMRTVFFSMGCVQERGAG